MIIRPKLWLIVSAVTILVSIAIIAIIQPVWGIDFTGGSLLEFSANNTDANAVRDTINSHQELGLTAQVQTTQDNSIMIRTEPLNEDKHIELVTVLKDAQLLEEELRFESIGPTIGTELRRKAWLAILATVAAMIAYLAYTFRQTTNLISSWKFGIAAAVALIHDLLVITALFVILGKFYGVAIDTLFVTAMLAILGYSVNDTIVLFNRLKETWLATRTGSLITIIDSAAKLTLIRSLNTSLTTLMVLVTLIIFGGSTILWFAVALAAGTVVGTYSSLFVAPPVLYALSKK